MILYHGTTVIIHIVLYISSHHGYFYYCKINMGAPQSGRFYAVRFFLLL